MIMCDGDCDSDSDSDMVDTTSMWLGNILGSGAQGTVFMAVSEKEEKERENKWFIKCHSEQRCFDCEVEFLAKLQGVPGVVQLKAKDDRELAFAGSPICKKITSLRGKISLFEMAVQVVDTLEIVHGKKIGHRDVRASNLLLEVNANGEVVKAILADWATAVVLGMDLLYEGAVHFASNTVLENLAKGETSFAFTAAMDLESLVKTVWDLQHPTFCEVSSISKKNLREILDWWTAREVMEINLAKYLKLARSEDYEELKKIWSERMQ